MNYTVACIDDDELVLQQYDLVFKHKKYNVLLGRNGFDLGIFMGDQTVDAIVLDLAMPGLDGLTSLKRIAATNPRVLKRIVVVSGALNDLLRKEISGLGVQTMAKPCDFEALVAAVEAIASR
jgi:DNA-binding response OmpR family regulator